MPRSGLRRFVTLGAVVLLAGALYVVYAADLTQNELVMGWRITAAEAKLTAMERRVESLSQKHAGLAQQVGEVQSVRNPLDARLASLEKRVGEGEWFDVRVRLVRLEATAEQGRVLLYAIMVAVIGQIANTVWKALIERRNGAKEGS